MSREPTPANRVAAVVLAAGESRRFGSPKQLARFGDRTLLERVLDVAAEAGLKPIVAVVPAWLTPPAGADQGIHWIRNAEPQRGMSHSLQLGFAALGVEVGAAVVLLGDQPGLPATSIASVIDRRGSRPIVAGWHDGHPIPPVLVERRKFTVVAETRGDAGLREILQGLGDDVTRVELPASADIDTQADLERLGAP